MRRNSRLSVMLHVLLHMRDGAVQTSEAIAAMMATNPVVVRRTMAGLRDAGIVRSEKGHGGGWSLARRLEEVTLADVYDALGAPTLFGIGHRIDAPTCPVERAVNGVIGQTLEEAEALVLTRLRSVTVADIVRDAAPPQKKGNAHA